MKANELMNGIYVYFNCFDGSKIIVKVTGFKDGVVYGVSKTSSHWCTIEKVEPIPITPENLKNNRFVPKFSDGCLTEYLIYKDIVDGIHEMYIKLYYFNIKETEHKLECFNCKIGGCQIWIKYVHQLQQALRLCGIDKEIEL